MKLFRATNGWFGNGDVHAWAIAEDEAAALVLLEKAFYDAGYAEGAHWLKEPQRVERAKKYSANITIECIVGDTSVPWAGEVSD